MPCFTGKLTDILTATVLMAASFGLLAGDIPKDPVFDFNFIFNSPLEPKTLKQTENNGIVVEEVEFTSDYDAAGKPIRTFGILAYQKDGKNLPGIVWAQGSMADAGLYFPEVFARKGYISISINLPKKEWNGWGVFNVSDPKNSNFVRIALTHMRAVTYLASRPESDKERIGIAGSSYGGMYANIVAGADPRIKAGMAFFAGGNHHMGTNLPQFTAMQTLEAIEIFGRTGDGGFRFRNRTVPFLWGVASNDHWFHMPAVVQTYIDAGGTDKRIAIKPQWDHGFPPEFDQELIDWFDIHLKKTRTPYNQPSQISVKYENGKMLASWSWTGENEVKKSELIVSYGDVRPWHGWVHRNHHRVSAVIDANRKASAEIPVFEPDMPVYIYANIIDSNNVLTSNTPVVLFPDKSCCLKKTASHQINAAPWGGFESEDIEFLKCHTELPFGVPDKEEKFSGSQSLRVETNGLSDKKHILKFKLFNVYERSHTLSMMIRSDKPSLLKIEVKGVYPSNWDKPAVKALLGKTDKIPAPSEIPLYSLEAATDGMWRQYTLECPYNNVPVEGYYLSIEFPKDKDLTFWLDNIEFITKWKNMQGESGK